LTYTDFKKPEPLMALLSTSQDSYVISSYQQASLKGYDLSSAMNAATVATPHTASLVCVPAVLGTVLQAARDSFKMARVGNRPCRRQATGIRAVETQDPEGIF
jgi:hypothetical protein